MIVVKITIIRKIYWDSWTFETHKTLYDCGWLGYVSKNSSKIHGQEHRCGHSPQCRHGHQPSLDDATEGCREIIRFGKDCAAPLDLTFFNSPRSHSGRSWFGYIWHWKTPQLSNPSTSVFVSTLVHVAPANGQGWKGTISPAARVRTAAGPLMGPLMWVPDAMRTYSVLQKHGGGSFSTHTCCSSGQTRSRKTNLYRCVPKIETPHIPWTWFSIRKPTGTSPKPAGAAQWSQIASRKVSPHYKKVDALSLRPTVVSISHDMVTTSHNRLLQVSEIHWKQLVGAPQPHSFAPWVMITQWAQPRIRAASAQKKWGGCEVFDHDAEDWHAFWQGSRAQI